MKNTPDGIPVAIVAEYPHGTPIEEVLDAEYAKDQSIGVQLWRHVIRRIRKLDRL